MDYLITRLQNTRRTNRRKSPEDLEGQLQPGRVKPGQETCPGCASSVDSSPCSQVFSQPWLSGTGRIHLGTGGGSGPCLSDLNCDSFSPSRGPCLGSLPGNAGSPHFCGVHSPPPASAQTPLSQRSDLISLSLACFIFCRAFYSTFLYVLLITCM